MVKPPPGYRNYQIIILFCTDILHNQIWGSNTFLVEFFSVKERLNVATTRRSITYQTSHLKEAQIAEIKMPVFNKLKISSNLKTSLLLARASKHFTVSAIQAQCLEG